MRQSPCASDGGDSAVFVLSRGFEDVAPRRDRRLLARGERFVQRAIERRKARRRSFSIEKPSGAVLIGGMCSASASWDPASSA